MGKRILLVLTAVAILAAVPAALFAQEAQDTQAADEQLVLAQDRNTHWKWIAAAISVGLSCIAGGIAVGQIGSAAMGAMSENPELSGRALPYVGLAEGICLWGFLVALLILFV